MRWPDAEGRDVPPGEVGELIVKQPGFCGYLGQPEKTAAVLKEGWFYTGNMVSMDEDGFIYLQCKREDIGMLPADKSGKFVMPYKAQDSIVNELDDVVEASLITIADPTYRAKFRIIVRTKAEAKVSEEQIKQIATKTIPDYLVTDVVVRREPLPKMATGKILVRELAKQYDGIIPEK